MSLLDIRTRTLIAGDCLQQDGIYGSGIRGANIRYPAEHLSALAKLRTMDIRSLLSAHDYHPLGHWHDTPARVAAVWDACEAALMRIKAYLEAEPQLTDEQLAARYREQSALPPIGDGIFAAMREAVSHGRI